MAASEDTEITLGTGKMLFLFFGLVALCAVFFAMGFSLGKNSVKPTFADVPATSSTAQTGPRPSAVKTDAAAPASDMTFYKAVEKKDGDQQLSPPETALDSAPSADGAAPHPDPVAAVSTNGYYVQVAAVSKQEDAEALVDALKKKQYPAFSNSGTGDKLFHVQVGPYADVKDAESTRAKLVGDGYNPILKK